MPLSLSPEFVSPTLSLSFVPYPSFSLCPLLPGLPLSLNIEDEARRGEKGTNSFSL
ncbi:hypothetical protein AMTRI_Chr03g142620 [Amborella trichopoda]